MENDLIPPEHAATLMAALPTATPEQKPQMVEILTRYRDQQAKRENTAEMQFRRQFTDPITFGMSAEETARADEIFRGAPNPKALKLQGFNIQYLSRVTGRPVDEVSSNYEAAKKAFGQYEFGDENLTDEGLHAKIGEGFKLEDKAFESATKAAMNGASPLNAWGAFSEEVVKSGVNSPKRLHDLHEQWQANYAKTTPKLEEFRDLILDVSKDLKRNLGEETKPGFSFRAIAEKLLTVPPESRDLVIAAIGETGSKMGDKKQNLLMDALRAAGRSGESLSGGVVATGARVGVQAARAEMPDFIVGKEGVGAMDAQVAKTTEFENLVSRIRAIATGKISPIDRTGLIRKTVVDTAASVPQTLASLIPVAGPIAIGAQFREEDLIQYLDAGVPQAEAEVMASIGAPIKTFGQVVVSRFMAGTLPALGKLFTSPTLTTASGLLRFGGRTAVGVGGELLDENGQQITPLIIQEIGHALDSDIGGADWVTYTNNLWELQKDILGPALLMSGVGAGGVTLHNLGASKALAGDRDLLIASNYQPDRADAIVKAFKSGDMAEAQHLMRANWNVAEVPDAERKAAADRYVAKSQEAAATFQQQQKAAGISIEKVGTEWEVSDGTTTTTFPEHAEAMKLVASSLDVKSAEDKRAFSKIAWMPIGAKDEAGYVTGVADNIAAMAGVKAGSFAAADPAGGMEGVAAAVAQSFKDKPTTRIGMLAKAQEMLAEGIARWNDVIESANQDEAANLDVIAKHSSDLQRLRADFDIDMRELRDERELEMGGAKTDGAGADAVTAIKKDFEARLTKRRLEYERQRNDINSKITTLEAKTTTGKERERIGAALRTLDSVAAVFPAEVRAKIGGFVKIAELPTDAARMKEIEARFSKIPGLLEKYFKKEANAEVLAVFEKYRPERTAGEKPKGKLGADAQRLVDAAEAAMDLDADKTAGRIADLQTQIDSGNLTAEQELQADRELRLVELFGDWKNADAARMAAALNAIEDTASEGWAKWKLAQIMKREERQARREGLMASTKRKGLGGERDSVAKESAGIVGKSLKALLNLSSFSDVLRYTFGEKSKEARAMVEAERKASNQYEDAVQDTANEVETFFSKLAGGVLEGEKLRFDMAQPTLTVGTGANQRLLSELQGIQALLMWQQEDGRRHMEGPTDENGKPVEGKWSYDQAWIDELTGKLSAKARQVKSFIESQYGAEWAVLNPVYRERHGVDLPKNDRYAPITVAPQQAKAGQMVDPVSGAAIAGSILTPGSLRTRNRSAIAEPQFRDALATFIGHNKQMQHWLAYYDFAVEAQAVLGNREVANAVEASATSEAVTVLRKWVDVFAQGGTRDAAAGLEITKLAQNLTGRAAVVGLLGRVSTLLVQSTQLGAASVGMPVGAYLTRFGKLMSGNLAWGDAIKSDFIQRRIKSAPPIVQQAMKQLGDVGRPNLIKHAVRAMGNLLSGADGLFTAGTYAMLLDYHREMGAKMGMEGAALEAYAHNEAATTTERIAQPTRPANRSLFEVTLTNPLAKVGFAYASESRQKIALFAWAAKNAGKDPVAFGKVAFLTFIVGGLMSQVLKNLWKDAKGDDDEKKWSAERLALSALGGPLHGIPLIGELSGDGGMLSGAIYGKKAASDILDGEGDMRDVETLLSTAGYFNDTAAGIAALSHAGYDFAKLLGNLLDGDGE